MGVTWSDSFETLVKYPRYKNSIAYSPSINVLDGKTQMIKSVQGVGLVVNGKRDNRDRVIINQIRDSTEEIEEDGMQEIDYWQRYHAREYDYKHKPKYSR